MFGGIEVSGKLPVNLKGVAKVGEGISLPKIRLGFSSPVAQGFASWLTDSIDSAVKNAIRSRAIPGCQVLVAKNGEIVLDKAYGRLSTTESAHVDRTTVYDLASVSKAVGTLPGIMKAYDKGLIALDDSIVKYIPELSDSAKRRITLRELLYHQSGMPASLNMFDVMIDNNSYTGKLIRPRRDKAHTVKVYNRVWANNTAKMRQDIVKKVRGNGFEIEAAKGIFTGKLTYDTVMKRIYDIPFEPIRITITLVSISVCSWISSSVLPAKVTMFL